MIFGNPWAWIGLAGIIGPIIAHLLARRMPRRQLFPHLAFLPATAATPISRDRPRDLLLLALRCAIVAAATMALAQPLVVSAARARNLGRQIARAVVIDTSASVPRDAALREAASAASSATTARTAESDAPSTVIDGAVAWLAAQPMRRELVVVSDFQPQAFGRGDLERVPAGMGVRLVRVAAGLPTEAPIGDRVGAKVGAAPATAPIRLLAGTRELPLAEAARTAAIATGAPATGRADRPVAVLFPQSPDRAALIGRAEAIDQPWMYEVVRAIRNDATFEAATGRARRDGGEPLRAIRARVDDRDTLVIVTDAPAQSVVAAALIGALARAVSAEPPAGELVAATRTDDELRAWEREAAAARAAVSPAARAAISPDIGAAADASDGRWVWIGCLALMGAEMFVRRSRG